MTSTGRLTGKVAIVTGAARGTGAAIARELVREGAAVVVADVLDDRGEATVDELGPTARYRPSTSPTPTGGMHCSTTSRRVTVTSTRS